MALCGGYYAPPHIAAACNSTSFNPPHSPFLSLPEADHHGTAEGQSREKRRKVSKRASAGCPFYTPGPLENFRDLALVRLNTIAICSHAAKLLFISLDRLQLIMTGHREKWFDEKF